MNTGQTNVEHNLRLVDGIINEMAHLFYKHKKGTEDSEEKNEHLSMLAGKMGYLVNISVGATKTWNYEERIMELEKAKEDPMYKTKKEFMFNPDVMLTVVRDNNGKIMN